MWHEKTTNLRVGRSNRSGRAIFSETFSVQAKPLAGSAAKYQKPSEVIWNDFFLQW